MLHMVFLRQWTCNRLEKQKLCRFMSVKRLMLRFLAFSCLLLTITFDAHAEDNPSNARELLLPVVEALKVIEKPQTGRGSAIRKIYDASGYNESYITFVFKDELSRTDRFEYSDGKKEKRIGARAMGPQVYVGFNPHNAIVLPSPAKEWHRELSRDFHPDTFSNINHYSIADLIQRLIEGSASISLELDNSDFLKIKSDYRDDKVELKKEYWFDKAAGFRLVLRRRNRTNLESGETSISCLRLSWKQYEQTWYVSKGEYEAGPAYSYKIGEEPQVKKPFQYRQEFVIENLTPNVDVNDSEFTLDGLDLPDGMSVVDTVSGVTYQYGTVPLSTADLEKPLAQAEFPAAITDSMEKDSNKTSIDSGMTGLTHDPNDSNGGQDKPDSLDRQIKSGRKNLLLVTGIVAFGALIIILTWKYLRLWR